MLGAVVHIGLTVSDMERSKQFYGELLGLKFLGEMLMEGPETDALFGGENCRAKVAYFKGSEEIHSPSIELIHFLDAPVRAIPSDLRMTSISEVCFVVDDIDAVYQHLVASGVDCISAPQSFDFTDDGLGRSKAIYFRDPDGIILELMEYLD
ncbi:MAG: VOC family protein [Eubacteriales bacterium]|nr:VOC family protein [Eubacteriales bacterium]